MQWFNIEVFWGSDYHPQNTLLKKYNMNPYKAKVIASEEQLESIGISAPLTGIDVLITYHFPQQSDMIYVLVEESITNPHVNKSEWDIPLIYLLPYTDKL